MTSTTLRFIKKPHAAIICGATDCGKTEFTLNLLETEYKDFFKYIVIICPTWRNNKTYLKRKWLFNDPDHVFLVDPKEFCSKSKDPLNDTLKAFFEIIGKVDESQVLFLVDDCSAEKGMKKEATDALRISIQWKTSELFSLDFNPEIQFSFNRC